MVLDNWDNCFVCSLCLFFLNLCMVGAGYKDQLVETKTAEVSHFLHMLRSVSSDDSGRSNTSHTDWKVCY